MRRLRLLGLTATLGVLAVTLSGCSWRDVVGLGWPQGITPEAHENYKLWIGSVIAAFVVGILVWGLTFWTSAFHRHKKGDTELPRQFGYNMPLELVLTVTPFLIIAVLFYFTVVVQERMLKKEADPAVVVDVTAFQWNWKFGYRSVDFPQLGWKANLADDARKSAQQSIPEGKDSHGEEKVGAIKGRNPEDRSYLNYDKVETIGTSDEIPVLVLPSHARIQFQLASADVVHSFWIIDFLFKRDVLPNPKANHTDNIFQVTSIDKEGAFVGRCAELCGTYHSMMNFEVRVVNRDVFRAYMQYRIDHPNAPNAEAMHAVGLPDKATKTEPFTTRRGQQSLTAAQTAAGS
ncbi:MAG TPA: cytochrome c oxidase subunit II [Mycobacterium sp.]|nr:cytochrome c oxidase subunit II [Mycobacterium sp.]